jgi:hypothetical protein
LSKEISPAIPNIWADASAINLDFSVAYHKLKSSFDVLGLFLPAPLVILDLLMMGVGFMFLGVYPLSVPVSSRSQ